MKFILGTKLNMTQIWRKEDEVVAVTAIQVGPCIVTQIKTEDRDGYYAVQLGFGKKKEKNINKPQKYLKKLGYSRFLREFRIPKEEITKLKQGNIIQIDTFNEGDKIKAIGTSKGKGFQGVVKRHGFAGAPKTHGTKDQLRMPGSIGATGPAHVFKGVKMAGRMGGNRVTVTNLEVVKIDTENNILYIKGAIPGSKGRLVLIIGEGELKVRETKKEISEKKEKIKEGAEKGSKKTNNKENDMGIKQGNLKESQKTKSDKKFKGK